MSSELDAANPKSDRMNAKSDLIRTNALTNLVTEAFHQHRPFWDYRSNPPASKSLGSLLTDCTIDIACGAAGVKVLGKNLMKPQDGEKKDDRNLPIVNEAVPNTASIDQSNSQPAIGKGASSDVEFVPSKDVSSLQVALRGQAKNDLKRAVNDAFAKMANEEEFHVREQGGADFEKLLYANKDSYLACMEKLREKPLHLLSHDHQRYIKTALSQGRTDGPILGDPRTQIDISLHYVKCPEELEKRLAAWDVIASVPRELRSPQHGPRQRDYSGLLTGAIPHGELVAGMKASLISTLPEIGAGRLRKLQEELKEMNAKGEKGIPNSIYSQIANELFPAFPTNAKDFSEAMKNRECLHREVVRDFFSVMMDSDKGFRSFLAKTDGAGKDDEPFSVITSMARQSGKIDTVKLLYERLNALANADVAPVYRDKNGKDLSREVLKRWARKLHDRVMPDTSHSH
jgi:hypothetical protein